MGRGWEHVLEANLEARAPTWAEEAVRKLSARSVEPARYDLVLDPSNLWLTIHESIAHPTELDRAMVYEADYAGTSFLAPPRSVLGTFRYGQPLMNIQADRRQVQHQYQRQEAVGEQPHRPGDEQQRRITLTERKRRHGHPGSPHRNRPSGLPRRTASRQ